MHCQAIAGLFAMSSVRALTLQARVFSRSKSQSHVFSLLTSRSQSFGLAHGRSTIGLGQKLGELSKSNHNVIRTLCTSSDLSTKKCVPCSSEVMRPMMEEAANTLIHQVPGWNLVVDDGIMKLHQSWKVKTFMKGLEFFKLVASVAEAEGHHPDLHLVGWNNVKIDIWTHAVGGLTENDFILAAKINGLDMQHLLSRKTK